MIRIIIELPDQPGKSFPEISRYYEDLVEYSEYAHRFQAERVTIRHEIGGQG